MPAVELLYVQVDVPVAPGTVVQETVRPVFGVITEVKETSPVNPRLATVIAEVVEDPDKKETVVIVVASLKVGA